MPVEQTLSVEQKSLPYFAEGEVVSGFGRGSKELGIPTANFPEDVIKKLPPSFECGVYYGWAQLSSNPQVFKMTMCVGWNPYYNNTVKTMETHIIHQFDADFYGDIMKIIVLGFIRPMCDFPSLDALIKAIYNDIEVSNSRLATAESLQYKDHPFFLPSSINATTPSAADDNKIMQQNDSGSQLNHSSSVLEGSKDSQRSQNGAIMGKETQRVDAVNAAASAKCQSEISTPHQTLASHVSTVTKKSPNSGVEDCI